MEGARGIGLRSYWIAELVDPLAALKHYKQAQPEALKAWLLDQAQKDANAGKRAIPGFAINEDREGGMNMFDACPAHSPGDAVHWRAQTLKGDGTAAMALAYIDARDVMRRLDEVCGPDGWSDSYTETAKGRLLCTISIKCGDAWISKSDGAGDTDVEGEKGAISDAFKRAAVKWGVGRYLYDMDAIWAECESADRNGKKYWRKWTPRGLAQLKGAAGSAVAPSSPGRTSLSPRSS
ncbi:hypothetical protein EP837_00001 [Sphingobium sp. EP60837]|nr:hypothetical protein EP837_00001 [Sphingobium sp. EP60837]